MAACSVKKSSRRAGPFAHLGRPENPTNARAAAVKQHFGLSIPEDAMDDDIEESARFFELDNGELHIRLRTS